MRIEERKFTFIPEKKWKNLTKKEQKILGSYKSYYENYKRTIDEIKELEKKDFLNNLIETSFASRFQAWHRIS